VAEWSGPGRTVLKTFLLREELRKGDQSVSDARGGRKKGGGGIEPSNRESFGLDLCKGQRSKA